MRQGERETGKERKNKRDSVSHCWAVSTVPCPHPTHCPLQPWRWVEGRRSSGVRRWNGEWLTLKQWTAAMQCDGGNIEAMDSGHAMRWMDALSLSVNSIDFTAYFSGLPHWDPQHTTAPTTLATFAEYLESHGVTDFTFVFHEVKIGSEEDVEAPSPSRARRSVLLSRRRFLQNHSLQWAISGAKSQGARSIGVPARRRATSVSCISTCRIPTTFSSRASNRRSPPCS